MLLYYFNIYENLNDGNPFQMAPNVSCRLSNRLPAKSLELPRCLAAFWLRLPPERFNGEGSVVQRHDGSDQGKEPEQSNLDRWRLSLCDPQVRCYRSPSATAGCSAAAGEVLDDNAVDHTEGLHPAPSVRTRWRNIANTDCAARCDTLLRGESRFSRLGS